MNREEGKSSRLVKISLVVIFFAIALFVCIKIENNKKPKDEKSSYGVVRSATVSEIREPRLYMYNKVLVSETGAIYDSFSESNNVRASFSYDHKQAAITVDGKLYYSDGYLRPVMICRGVQGYGEINRDGGYILYCDESESSVMVYDIAKNEHIRVASELVKDSKYAISSNGKYVTLFYKNKTRIVPYGQNAPTSPVAEDKLIPIAVSDDGQRAFYYDINKRQDKTWVYSYHDGQLYEISEFEGANTWSFVVNKDCTDIFINGKVLWYYSNRNDKLRRVIGNNVKKFYFSEELSQIFEGYSRVQIVDVPTLEGCLVDSYRGNFWFYDVKKDAIKFSENEDFECLRIIDKELKYLFIKDGYVYKGSITTNRRTEEKFVELEYQARNVAANEDFSVIWFIDTDNCLHKYHNNHMYDLGDTGYNDAILKYVPCEKKLYYINNGAVLAFDELTDEKTIVAERCRSRNDLNSDYGDFAGYTDFSGRKVVSIFGNIILTDE